MYEYLGSVSLGDQVREQRAASGIEAPVAVLHDQRPARRTVRRTEMRVAA